MTKYFKYKLIGLALIVASFVGCDTADQDVSPIISPDGKPVATFSIDRTSGLEGESLVVTITTDKTIDRAVTFTPSISGGLADNSDFKLDPIVLPPYYKEVTKELVLNVDDFPEATENTQITFSVKGIAERYLLNPSQTFPALSFDIENVNDPTLLSIAFGWNTEDDIDMVIWTDTDTYPWQAWSSNGATGANPELDYTIWTSDPNGDYYVSIIDWGAGPFDYTFSIGHPDGTVQIITGTFDETVKTYTIDPWVAWGAPNTYRVLKVVHTGDTFTVTAL